MNEYVFVEFLAGKHDESARLCNELTQLGSEFVLINILHENEQDEDGNFAEWLRIEGKMNSQYASVLKLQNVFLAERMRVSYIPEELKNKYRR